MTATAVAAAPTTVERGGADRRPLPPGHPETLLDLPILAEVPELGAALAAARGIDRLVAQLLDSLLLLEEHGIAEATTGVALEQWLAIVGQRTHADRRMLLTACDVLRRLPSLRRAFVSTGDVSWSQVRAVALAVHRLPRHLDDRLDAEVARAVRDCVGSDPDALARTVGQTLASITPEPQASSQQVADRAQYLALQPRLDGSGGRLWGDFGPEGFAVLDAALHPASDPPVAGVAAGCDEVEPSDAAQRRATGAARAQRLLDLVDHDCGDTSVGARRQLVVRAELSTLLDREQVPAHLLTLLTGGRMWVDAATARRLVDERGADLRTVILDDTGTVVGVGRRSRLAPGWLRDAQLALHDTCSAPGCQVAARRCDSDHAMPWVAHHRDDPPGRTDVEQLAPLCPSHNRAKERDGWRVTQAPDGTRTWRHERTGLSTRTHPATWRPPPI